MGSGAQQAGRPGPGVTARPGERPAAGGGTVTVGGAEILKRLFQPNLQDLMQTDIPKCIEITRRWRSKRCS